MRMTDRETATVLAALRYWQLQLPVEPYGPRDVAEIAGEIAEDGGRFPMLTAEEIDELCERINCREDAE